MVINGKDSILESVVFELRYRHGLTYLDKCGRTINSIMRDQPEWLLKGGSPDPQNAGLVSVRNGCNFNFSGVKLDTSLQRPSGGEPLSGAEVGEFAEQTEILTRIVIDQLGLNDFARIGFRAWYLFSCNSKEEAERWILNLGYYNVGARSKIAFKGEVETTNFTMILASHDRKFRIALNSVENQAQLNLGKEILSVRASGLPKDQREVLLKQMKVRHRMLVNPEFAAMIDVDAFQEDPISVDPEDFIKTSIEQVENGLSTIVKN
jgi:hypothetical protein